MLIFAVLGLIALLAIALVIFAIAKIASRTKGGGAPAAYAPGWQQPHGQQSQGNPYVAPQPGQPQQSQSPWGNR